MCTELEVKPKPCPWCGKLPTFYKSYGGQFLEHTCNIIVVRLGIGEREELITQWNNRKY